MKVRDPVCGMVIEDSEAAGAYPYEGKTYYFCSPSCLVEFEKDPKVYAGRARPPDIPADREAGKKN